MKYKNYLLPTIITIVFYVILHFIGIGCPIRYVTGIPCAGCGMTRAWLAALHLDFVNAFYYHPLFWLIPVLLFLFFMYHKGKVSKKVAYRILGFIIIIFTIVYIIRLFSPTDTIVKIHLSNSVFIKLIKYLLERSE